MMRAAAVLAWFAGLGFGLPCGYAIWYIADRGHVWTFLGFPTYGGGPFEDIGIRTTVPLLVLFLLVCVAELIAGWWLWHCRRAGAVLALALLPPELDLPAGPVLGLARTALVLLGWRSLSQRKAQPAGLRQRAVQRRRSGSPGHDLPRSCHVRSYPSGYERTRALRTTATALASASRRRTLP
jgi:hypothetical protein